MMFSTVLPLSPESRLSHHLPLLQHIVGVAVVHGIRSREGYGSLPLTIKWPNDIYYQSKVKLGGILVSCLSVGNNTSHTAVIGKRPPPTVEPPNNGQISFMQRFCFVFCGENLHFIL